MQQSVETIGGDGQRVAEIARIPKASMQFHIDPDRVPWIFASLMNAPQVVLYKGEFPEPFRALNYYATTYSEDQLGLQAQLLVGEEFNERYGSTVGSLEDLAPLLGRYTDYGLNPDGDRLIVARGKEPFGVIARHDNLVVIQRGGGAGQLSLSEASPINDLSIALDQFGLFVGRYVSSIWKAFPETNQKDMQLTLDVLGLPKGAPRTYYSIPEIWSREFSGNIRPLDLETGIGGHPRIKDILRSLMVDLTRPEIAIMHGTQPYSTKLVLLSGREGTGKSQFQRGMIDLIIKQFGDAYRDYSLPLHDMISTYGGGTAHIVRNVFDQARENERAGVPTFLHIDGLEALVPPQQRATALALSGESFVYAAKSGSASDAEFEFWAQVVNPIVREIARLGKDLGPNSRNVIVLGESRLPREFLPDGVTRAFRRSFSLDRTTTQDFKEVLQVQMATSRTFSEGSGHDPFAPGFEGQLDEMAKRCKGFVFRDIPQIFSNIQTRKKAGYSDENGHSPATPEDFYAEVENLRLEKGLKVEDEKGEYGFLRNITH